MKVSFLAMFLTLTMATAFCQVKDTANPKAILNGKWITTDYVKELRSTLSPHQAQLKAKAAYQLFIDIKPSDKNSTLTDMWTLHEGGLGFTIYFKPGVKKDTWKTGYTDADHPGTAFSDIGYEVAGKDTRLVLYHYSKKNKLTGKTYFTKAGMAGMHNDRVLGYEVNKIIFSGSYRFTDSTGKIQKVKFTNNGTVTGLRGFQKYDATSFFMEQKNFYDEINFTGTDKSIVSYAFKKEANKLFLYELEKEDNDNYRQGALKYTLVKD